MSRCARSAWRSSRPTSTSRWSRTSSRGSGSARSAHEVLESLSAGQQVVKIVNDELVALLSAGDRTFHLSRQPGRRRDGRSPGLGQDDLDAPSSRATSSSSAADRCSSPPTRTVRRPPTSSRRSGETLDIPVYRAPVGHAGRGHRPRRRRGGQAPGARRRDPRHRRPPLGRRGADGRDRRGERGGPSRSRRCSSSTP